MKSNILKSLLAAATVAGLAATAGATPITGTIGFTGTGSASVSAGTTTINFNNDFTVSSALGDYPSSLVGDSATLKAISYTGDGLSAVLSGTVSDQYNVTVGTTVYSFDLTSISSAHTVIGVSGALSSVSMSGLGVAHITGYDDTYGSFSLSGTGTGSTFTFQSESTTSIGQRVPDGGTTAMLLGAALSGLALIRRKLV